jgi:hypothetical protein
MGTTPIQDQMFFDTLRSNYPIKPVRSGGGEIKTAGIYWPTVEPQRPGGFATDAQRKNYRLQLSAFNNRGLAEKDVQIAFTEARGMAIKGLIVALAALRGDEGAVAKMTRWFGPRPAKPITAGRDWWEGAARIIGVIESFVTSDIKLYYRGDESLIGKRNDYPNKTGNLTAADVSGYAESFSGAKNNIIGLCKLFFEKEDATQRAKMNLRGADSVGGTLVHELSHNLCETKDHEGMDGGACYGTEDCLKLAGLPAKPGLPRRAWYNADNIEYFCEEVYYGSFKAEPTEVTPTKSNIIAKQALVGKVISRTLQHPQPQKIHH